MKFHRILFAVSAFTLIALPLQAQTTDWSQARRIDIGLSSYAFTPSVLQHLQHGVPYVLHFTNTAAKSHDFSAPALFAAATIAPADASKVVDGSVDLDDGQSADVKLVVNTPESYDVTCTHFMHAMLGMTGKVIVE